MTHGRAAQTPPRAAVRLLASAVPAADREAIVGDLTEVFADRIEARRRFNVLWFWASAFGFAAASVAAAVVPGADRPSGRQLMGRLWHHFKTSGLVMLGALPVGSALSLSAAPLFAGLVYGVGHRDGNSLAIAVVIALVTGVVGTWVPVRRSANANVVKVLREA